MRLLTYLAGIFGFCVCSGCRCFVPLDTQVCCFWAKVGGDALNLNFCPRCYKLFREMEAHQR